ncbi:MAG: ABC transporter permease [Anaerolineae bacterium]
MFTQLADLLENIRVALDGLLANKLRSTLTMLGVIIGVGAVIALMSVGEGAQTEITGQISSIGTNLLVVMPTTTGRVGGGGSASGGLTMDDVEALTAPSAVPDASLIVPQYNVNGQIIYGDTNFSASGVGTTPDYLALNNLTLAEGDFISARDIEKRAKVAVLGAQVAQDLFSDFNPVGQKIKIANAAGTQKTSLTVIGVLEEKGGSMLADADNSVYVPISTAQTKLANARNALGKLTASRIDVMAASESQVDAAYSQIEAILNAQHGIGPLDDADFSIINQADMLAMATSITGTLTVFLGAVAGISLLVGGIGIMNIMLVSVTERTREIGLRKAVGARKGDVLFQFLMEAIILSLIGGSIGILVGIGVGQLVSLTGMVSSVVTVESIVLAVGFSLATGLFFGIYPANQAASLNPIEALRYE